MISDEVLLWPEFHSQWYSIDEGVDLEHADEEETEVFEHFSEKVPEDAHVRGQVWDSEAARRTGVGVTKLISSVPLISKFVSIVNTRASYWISCLYLTGVAAAQLRWHVSNINVIQEI